jgi:hypothetical protein
MQRTCDDSQALRNRIERKSRFVLFLVRAKDWENCIANLLRVSVHCAFMYVLHLCSIVCMYACTYLSCTTARAQIHLSPSCIHARAPHRLYQPTAASTDMRTYTRHIPASTAHSHPHAVNFQYAEETCPCSRLWRHIFGKDSNCIGSVEDRCRQPLVLG